MFVIPYDASSVLRLGSIIIGSGFDRKLNAIIPIKIILKPIYSKGLFKDNNVELVSPTTAGIYIKAKVV
jgi:hypothetical protein